MNARKWINNCFAGYFSVSLMGLVITDTRAESGFLSVSPLKTKYSRDIASLNYTPIKFESGLHIPQKKTSLSLPNNDGSKLQKKAGKAVFKALNMSNKKLATNLAGAALLYGLGNIDMAEPVKNGIFYIKEKTRFNFGKCSQISFSTKRLKAKSCFLNDRARLEFHANYKMDAFRLKFNWPM